MPGVANRSEVRAELERLPWQRREALFEAVGQGKAVREPELARLAADHAEVAHREVVRVCLWVITPLALLVVGGSFLLMPRGNGGASAGGSFVAGALTFTMIGALMWAMSLRPLTRARQANLHLAGLAEHAPSRREASHWVLAWLIAWPIAAFIAAGLGATGLEVAGPLGFVAWVTILWFAKRALDERASPAPGSSG